MYHIGPHRHKHKCAECSEQKAPSLEGFRLHSEYEQRSRVRHLGSQLVKEGGCGRHNLPGPQKQGDKHTRFASGGKEEKVHKVGLGADAVPIRGQLRPITSGQRGSEEGPKTPTLRHEQVPGSIS